MTKYKAIKRAHTALEDRNLDPVSDEAEWGVNSEEIAVEFGVKWRWSSWGGIEFYAD